MPYAGEDSPATQGRDLVKKKTEKKLVLAKETVRSLVGVRGGEIPYTMSCGTVCYLSAPKYCPNQNTAGNCNLP